MTKETFKKHKEVIEQWAEGAPIQFRVNGNETWMDVDNPNWYSECEYRVKPASRELDPDEQLTPGARYKLQYNGRFVLRNSTVKGEKMLKTDYSIDRYTWQFIGEDNVLQTNIFLCDGEYVSFSISRICNRGTDYIVEEVL